MAAGLKTASSSVHGASHFPPLVRYSSGILMFREERNGQKDSSQ
jgi:hypothetical protein